MSTPTDTPAQARTKAETADRLRVSRSTLDRLIADGEIRAKRIGRRVIVTDSEIARFLGES